MPSAERATPPEPGEGQSRAPAEVLAELEELRAGDLPTHGGRTLAYVYEGLPSKLGLVRGRRLQKLSQVPGGPTVYDTVEEFSGPLVALAGPDRVAEGFQRHADALKVRAESVARGD